MIILSVNSAIYKTLVLTWQCMPVTLSPALMANVRQLQSIAQTNYNVAKGLIKDCELKKCQFQGTHCSNSSIISKERLSFLVTMNLAFYWLA
jgi:hypothetical protein